MKIAIIGRRFFLVAACSLGLATAFGTTRYVDCNLQDYAGHDGSSWEMAYKTIQEGVDAAQTDDVVLVAPGWYDEGGATMGSSENYLTNRVCIRKRITVKSRDGRATRDSTFIVGRHASPAMTEDPAGLGLGLDAVRCVRFDTSATISGASVEGFTIINGATHYNGGTHKAWSAGGGVYAGVRTSFAASSAACFIVDCVVSNCVAPRGGGMYFGNAVRCRITENSASENGAGVRDSNLYHCIVDCNYGGGASIVYIGGTRVVNCTIVNNSVSPIKGNNRSDGTYGLACNTVVLQNYPATGNNLSLTNCVLPSSCNYCMDANVAGGYSTNHCLSVDAGSYQFVSTATGDLRPLSSGDLIGAGDADLLAYIPEAYRYTDYEGKPVPATGAIAVGAIQTPVTPTGGCISYKSAKFRSNDTFGLRVNGYEHCVEGLYSFAVKYPDPYLVECLMPRDPAKLDVRKFFAFSGNQDKISTIYHFPLRGTTKSYFMSPTNGSVLVVSTYVTENSLWTDPSVADDAEMDGTEEHPYNTLQAAVDRAIETQSYWVIFAKKGHYDKGGAFYGGVTNRVAFWNNKTYVRLYAVDGPDETFIDGAEDPSSNHGYGYGDAAVRCAASATGCASINGFTLSGGRVALNAGAEDPGATCLYGGGVYGISHAVQIEDCVFTNCAASRGAIAYGATLRRCVAVDCISTRNGALRGTTRASACVFRNIGSASADADCIVGQDDRLYNCTVIDNGSGIRLVADKNNAGIYNTIVYGLDRLTHTPSAPMVGSYYDGIGSVDASAALREGLTHADIGFSDPVHGDYALCSVSAPGTVGSMRALDNDFWAYGTMTDIEGVPLAIGDDGSVAAGAYQRTSPSVAILAGVTEGVSEVEVSPAGMNYATPAAPTVTITATSAGTRNFAGFYLNGEFVTANDTYTYTYTPGDDGVTLALEARYLPCWYVDPAKSDSNSGRDWSNAKRTLAEVMKLARPGDTVYAAPGIYDEGDMVQHANSYDGDPLLHARVVLTNNVSLVSRDGAEATVIMGRASAENVDGFGGGSDALRCAYLYDGARLVGFTLTGGRSLGQNVLDDNNRGVGVHGRYLANLPVVRDCIISNCVSARAGGAVYVTAVNCRLLYNRGWNICGAAQHSLLENCYIDYNAAGTKYGGIVLGYWTGIRNCTVGAHNETDTPIGPSGENGFQHPNVYNTLVLAGRPSSNSDAVFTNCAFTADALANWPALAITNDTCVFAASGQLQADENGVPTVGFNAAIDMGDTNYLDSTLCDTDLAGNPRIANGKMDIGCYEADWKGRYSEDLGARVAVSEASPMVRETPSRSVALVDGTALAFSMRNHGGRVALQTVLFRVNGAGTLTLTVDGGETLTFTDTGAEQTYQSHFGGETRLFTASFAGEGSAELIGGASVVGSTLILR